jgi:hypothetical protein
LQAYLVVKGPNTFVKHRILHSIPPVASKLFTRSLSGLWPLA